MMDKIAIGVDQSTKYTGLVAIQFGGKAWNYEVVEAKTVETPTKQDMENAILSMRPTYGSAPRLKVICAEWGYISTDKVTEKMDKGVAGLSTVRTATWVEMIAYYHMPLTMFCTASALIWRNLVWGTGKGRMSRKNAKAFSIHFAKHAGIDHPDDHQGDALGLAIYGMYQFIEREAEQNGNTKF